jgi:hypothetical protein
VIRLERVRLPDGLRALAHRDRNGNLVIYVSDGLDAQGQRAAIMAAIRASRRAGWRKTGLLPVGAALFLAIRALLGRVVRAIGAHPAAWGAATTATVVAASAAGIFIASAPPPHGASAARRPGGPSTVQPVQPSAQPPGGHAPRRRVHPVVVAHISPTPGQPRPAPTSPGRPAPPSPPAPSPSPAPPPAPAPSPTPTEPTPAPVPTSCQRHRRHPCIHTHGRHARMCRIIMRIEACLPSISPSLQV